MHKISEAVSGSIFCYFSFEEKFIYTIIYISATYTENSVNWLNIFFLSHNFFCTTRQLFRLLSLSFSIIFVFL